MKFIDCSASIGYATVNKKIINHENYPIVEKVDQAKDGAELLTFMDKCGIDEAIVYHQQQVDSSVAFGNRLLLSDERNYTGRLKGVLAIAPSITDEGFDVESLFKTIKKYDIFGVRVNPVQNRFMLDRITMGDIFDAIIPQDLGDDREPTFHLYLLKLIPEKAGGNIQEFKARLKQKGVTEIAHFGPLYRFKAVQDMGYDSDEIAKSCPNCEDIFYNRYTHLPIYGLSDEQLEYLADAVLSTIEEMKASK
jgi:hypothetical protein